MAQKLGSQHIPNWSYGQAKVQKFQLTGNNTSYYAV